MKITDILRLAFRIFKTNRLRTFLTILGVSIGIGAIFFLVSLGYGLQRLTEQRIATSDSLVTLDVTAGQSTIVRLDDNAYQSLSRIPHVEENARFVALEAHITLGDSTGEAEIRAVDANYVRLEGLQVSSGRAFRTDELDSIIISSSVLRLFSFSSPQDVMEKNVTLSNFAIPTITDTGARGEPKIVNISRQYRVVGIVNDDRVYVYAPLASLDELSVATYDNVKVKASHKDYVSEIRDNIVNQGFSVSAISDVLDQLDKVFRVVQIVLGGFGIIALTVAAIGMFNTMTIALLERTHEIGIMKSIGVANRDVWRLFLTESMVIGVSGGLLGMGIGWSLGILVNFIVNLLAQSFGGESVQLFWIPTWFVLLVMGFSAIVGFSTGLYPARRASHLNPLQALKYE